VIQFRNSCDGHHCGAESRGAHVVTTENAQTQRVAPADRGGPRVCRAGALAHAQPNWEASMKGLFTLALAVAALAVAAGHVDAKPKLKDFVFVKKFDKASPLLAPAGKTKGVTVNTSRFDPYRNFKFR
jgi:hypothetical protein